MVVDVDGVFVDLFGAGILVISVGREDGLNAAVVRLGGGVVRVGALVVGTGNVVPS